MKKLTDEELEEAYRDVFEGPPLYPGASEPSDDELEEMAGALFGPERNPYSDPSPTFDARERQKALQEAQEPTGEPLTDETVQDAADNLFV